MEWTNSADELELLLNLTQVPRVGAVRLRSLMAKFEKPSAVICARTSELAKIGGIDSTMAQEIKRAGQLGYGKNQLEKIFNHDYRIVTFWNPEYPGLLKHIDDPPIILYVWGQLLPIDSYSLAVVGTRVPSRYGRNAAVKLVGDLVEAGATIVSGLARGIDTIAHAETVKKGGRTIAVLGSGLDFLYPAENMKLAKAIVENGAVVSECPFGTKPDAVNFPRRNRIISGLSLGTIVIEAREKSGALITANIAIEQNREVFAVPGSIFSPQSQGCHQLIKDGAKLVNHIDDILEEIPQQGELFQRQEYTAKLPPELSDEQKRVLEKIAHQPVHIDTIARELNMESGSLLSVLLQLEFIGLVKQLPGKLFVRG